MIKEPLAEKSSPGEKIERRSGRQVLFAKNTLDDLDAVLAIVDSMVNR